MINLKKSTKIKLNKIILDQQHYSKKKYLGIIVDQIKQAIALGLCQHAVQILSHLLDRQSRIRQAG